MTEIKAQLITYLPYHRIEQPRKQNKYIAFFGAYIALPLMTVILVASLLILFLLVKTYFSNSYIYYMDKEYKLGKGAGSIGQIVDDRFNQFHSSQKPISSPIFSRKPTIIENVLKVNYFGDNISKGADFISKRVDDSFILNADQSSDDIIIKPIRERRMLLLPQPKISRTPFNFL